jgi:thiol:disulfide interchange protein DsbC
MKTPAFAAIAMAALLSLSAYGQVSPDSIKAELKKKLPEAEFESVRKIPYGNLYEVVSAGDVMYTDEKATFILLGPIIDLATKQNVTEARMRQLNAVKFETLSFDDAIKIVRGNGSRKLAIFEDPNCGYCKRFERDLLGVNDVTVYVFLYPILSPDSVEKSKAIWCSTDRAKAWLDTMTKDATPSGEGKCTTPLDKNLAFGHAKRINGTPTLIFESGERVPGVMPVAEVEKRLAMKVPPPSASAK